MVLADSQYEKTWTGIWAKKSLIRTSILLNFICHHPKTNVRGVEHQTIALANQLS